MIHIRFIFCCMIALTLALDLFISVDLAGAAQLTLSWNDASDNEDGFGIERRSGTSGAFQHIASVSSNVSTYTDPELGQ